MRLRKFYNHFEIALLPLEILSIDDLTQITINMMGKMGPFNPSELFIARSIPVTLLSMDASTNTTVPTVTLSAQNPQKVNEVTR